MRTIEICRSWVVYRMALCSGVFGGNVVCEEREWDVLERARPGFHVLIRNGIGSEQEAEKLRVARQVIPHRGSRLPGK